MLNAVERVIASPAIMAQIFAQLSSRWSNVNDPNKDSAIHKDEDEGEREERASCRSTLAACARVCRAFSDPALDAQWRVLDNVVVLLKILPHTVSRPGCGSGPDGGQDTNLARLDVLVSLRQSCLPDGLI